MTANPLNTNSTIDSCAFDPKYEPEASASSDILELADKGTVKLVIAHSTQKEIDHPNTPEAVKKRANEGIYTLAGTLTADEQHLRAEIHRILTGNGNPANVQQDAEHVFEAQKYGGHFITTDARILARAVELEALCGICVIRPSAFLGKVAALLAARH